MEKAQDKAAGDGVLSCVFLTAPAVNQMCVNVYGNRGDVENMRSDGIVLMNMSNIYKEQCFYRNVKGDTGVPVYQLDLTDLTGTDCYCDEQAQRTIKKQIERYTESGLHYIDSGNYHYITKLWLDQLTEPYELVLLDHHPDMQEPLFGPFLSCGGWVKDALDGSSLLRHVYSVGVEETLITDKMRAYGSRVTFYTEQAMDCGWKDWCSDLTGGTLPVYISVDKDVLAEGEVYTNWDQGKMKLEQMIMLLEQLFQKRQVLGMDICGELEKKPHRVSDVHKISRNNLVNNQFIHFINYLHKKMN